MLLIQPGPQAVEAPDQPPRAGVTPWVLLVVADENRRKVTREAWEQAGYAVEIARDAADAMDCLKVMTPSLIVTDDWVYRPAPR